MELQPKRIEEGNVAIAVGLEKDGRRESQVSYDLKARSSVQTEKRYKQFHTLNVDRRAQ